MPIRKKNPLGKKLVLKPTISWLTNLVMNLEKVERRRLNTKKKLIMVSKSMKKLMNRIELGRYRVVTPNNKL